MQALITQPMTTRPLGATRSARRTHGDRAALAGAAGLAAATVVLVALLPTLAGAASTPAGARPMAVPEPGAMVVPR